MSSGDFEAWGYGVRVNDAERLAQRAAAALEERIGVPRHDATVVLGSGWDPAADAFGRVVGEAPVGELPGFVVPVAPGHQGVVRSYDLDGMALLVFFGRTHLFEGLGPGPVAHPVRVGAATGARVAVLTNATGSLRADWQPGTGVLVRDHINWTRVSPLVGAAFVDLTDAWSPRLRAIARELEPGLVEGVYALMPGPSVQSGAETRMLRTLGADLVGMSVAVEAIAARAAGLELLGLSIASTIEDAGVALDPIAVLDVAHATARRLGPVIAGVLATALSTSVLAPTPTAAPEAHP
jgi:purine-nucleoside phosphorylase